MIRNKDDTFTFSLKTQWLLRTQSPDVINACLLAWSKIMVSHARITKTNPSVIGTDGKVFSVFGGSDAP